MVLWAEPIPAYTESDDVSAGLRCWWPNCPYEGNTWTKLQAHACTRHEAKRTSWEGTWFLRAVRQEKAASKKAAYVSAKTKKSGKDKAKGAGEDALERMLGYQFDGHRKETQKTYCVIKNPDQLAAAKMLLADMVVPPGGQMLLAENYGFPLKGDALNMQPIPKHVDTFKQTPFAFAQNSSSSSKDHTTAALLLPGNVAPRAPGGGGQGSGERQVVPMQGEAEVKAPLAMVAEMYQGFKDKQHEEQQAKSWKTCIPEVAIKPTSKGLEL